MSRATDEGYLYSSLFDFKLLLLRQLDEAPMELLMTTVVKPDVGFPVGELLLEALDPDTNSWIIK